MDLGCFLRNEKTGRRFWRGGVELFGTGDDGGLDLGTSSDHIAGDDLGLDVAGSEISRVKGRILEGEEEAAVVETPTSLLAVVFSTRLRLFGGSSSQSARFWRE
jgi:hypothetical protein